MSVEMPLFVPTFMMVTPAIGSPSTSFTVSYTVSARLVFVPKEMSKCKTSK
jgi:hypothetical protein